MILDMCNNCRRVVTWVTLHIQCLHQSTSCETRALFHHSLKCCFDVQMTSTKNHKYKDRNGIDDIHTVTISKRQATITTYSTNSDLQQSKGITLFMACTADIHQLTQTSYYHHYGYWGFIRYLKKHCITTISPTIYSFSVSSNPPTLNSNPFFQSILILPSTRFNSFSDIVNTRYSHTLGTPKMCDCNELSQAISLVKLHTLPYFPRWCQKYNQLPCFLPKSAQKWHRGSAKRKGKIAKRKAQSDRAAEAERR